MIQGNDIFELLKTIPWFLELKPQQLKQLAQISTLQDVPAGDLLFSEGDRDTSIYIILEGQMTLTTRIPNRGDIPIYIAEPLDVIGWSILTPVVRQFTCSTRAAKNTRLLVLQGDNLRRLCEDDHDLGYIIMRRIANVIATRLLTMRVHLLEAIVQRDSDRRPVTME